MVAEDLVTSYWATLIEQEQVGHLARELRGAESIYRKAVAEVQSKKVMCGGELSALYEFLNTLYSQRDRAHTRDYKFRAFNVVTCLPGLRVIEMCIEIRRIASILRSKGRHVDCFNLNLLAENLLAPKRAQLERALK